MRSSRKQSAMESLKGGHGTRRRALFRTLAECVHETQRKKSMYAMAVEGDDQLGTDPELRERASQLGTLFPGLPKLDPKSVLEYSEEDLGTKCERALEVFRLVADKYLKAGQLSVGPMLKKFEIEIKPEPIKEDLLKICVICYDFILTNMRNGGWKGKEELELLMKKWCEWLDWLNIFIFLLVHSKRSANLLYQFEASLLQIVELSLGEIRSSLAAFANISAPQLILQYTLLCAAIASYCEGQEGAESGTGTDPAATLKRVISVMGDWVESLVEGPQLFALSLMQVELPHPLWFKHPKRSGILIAALFNRKVLQVVNCESTSLLHVSLYYFYHLLETGLNSGIPVGDSTTLGHITKLMKLGCSHMASHPAHDDLMRRLNENLVCLKLFKRLLATGGTSHETAEVLDISCEVGTVLAQCLSSHIDSPEFTTSSESSASYSQLVFKLLDDLRGTRSDPSEPRQLKPVADAILDRITECSVLSPLGKATLKQLVANYLVSDHTRQYAQLMKVYRSKLFNYTAPSKMDLGVILRESELKSDCWANSMLIFMISESLKDSKELSKELMLGVIRLLQEAAQDEFAVFGYLKLLYCTVVGQESGNVGFFKSLYIDSLNKMQVSDIQPHSQTKCSPLSLACWMDTRMMVGLVDVLLKRYSALAELGTEAGPRWVEVVERAVLAFTIVPSLTDSLLVTPRVFTVLLKFYSRLESVRVFAACLLQKCLVVMKYTKVPPGDSEKEQYLPNILIEYLASAAGTEKEAALNAPLFENLIEFLQYDLQSPYFASHQTMIYSSSYWKQLFASSLPPSLQFLKHSLHFLQLMFYRNDYNKDHSKEHGALARLGLAQRLRDFSETQPLERLDEVVKPLLEACFEVVCQMRSPQPHRVAHSYFLFCFLKLALRLTKKIECREHIGEYIKYVLVTVKNDYVNYYILSSGLVFNALVRLMFRFKGELGIARKVGKLVANISAVHVNSLSVQKLFRRLLEIEAPEDYLFVQSILDTILYSMTHSCFSEVFLFNGQSGVMLTPRTQMPEDGYCFFGHIRVEPSQDVQDSAQMCVFRLCAEREVELELFLRNMHVFYSVVTSFKDSKDRVEPIKLSSEPLERGVWHLLTLYHLSSGGSNLVMYIDGKETYRGKCRGYPARRVYKSNTVGCRMARNAEGEMVVSHGFHGVMTALHFCSVSSSTFSQIHAFLQKYFPLLEPHDFYPTLAFGKNLTVKELAQFDTATANLVLERMMIVVNPKCATKLCMPHERIYTLKLANKKEVELLNHVNALLKSLRVHHNTPLRNVVQSIGGIKCFFPCLMNLTAADVLGDTPLLRRRNKLVARTLEIVLEITLMDKDKAREFFESQEDLILLRYLLERLSVRGGLTENIYSALNRLLGVVKWEYSSAIETYFENILLNMNIWKHSETTIQEKIIQQTCTMFIGDEEYSDKVPKTFDILLNCIQVYNSEEADHSLRIRQIVAISSLLGQKHFRPELLHIAMSYANIYFLRRLNNFTRQIFYVLLVFHEIFFCRFEECVHCIKEGIRTKKSCKIICTMLTVLDYYLFEVSHQFSARYKGIVNEKAGRKSRKGEDKSAHSESLESCSRIPDQANIVDRILALCIYWLLSFDFKISVELSQEYFKGEPKERQSTDLLSFLIYNFGKSSLCGQSREALLLYAFRGGHKLRKHIFGPACYSAFVCLTFCFPFRVQMWQDDRHKQLNFLLKQGSRKEKLIRRREIFDSVFLHLSHFNPEARAELVSDLAILSRDPRLAEELCEDFEILRSVFLLPAFPETGHSLVGLHEDALHFMLSSVKHAEAFAALLNVWSVSPRYQLVIVEGLLVKLWEKPLKLTKEYCAGLLHLAQAVEDACTKDPNVFIHYPPYKLVIRLLFLLNRSGLLYVSMPVLATFDERAVSSGAPSREALNTACAREGGFVRILLKLLLVLCKFDPGEVALGILQYFIFRDKLVKRKLGDYAKVLKAPKLKETRRKLKHNLLDITSKPKPELCKAQRKIAEAFQTQSIPALPTLLELKQGAKPGPHPHKDRNVFESHAFLFHFLIGSLIQLLHYEIFGVAKYEEITSDSERNRVLKEILGNPDACLTHKATRIVELVEMFCKYEASINSGLTKKKKNIEAEVAAYLDQVQSKYGSIISSSHSRGISVQSQHNLLNQARYDGDNGGVALETKPVRRQEPVVEEEREEERKDDGERLRKFANETKRNVGLLLEFASLDSSSFTLRLMTIVLNYSYLNLITPCQMFSTSYAFEAIDSFVHSKNAPDYSFYSSGRKIALRKEHHAFINTLKRLIRMKFSYLGVAKAKLERDELATEFDELAGMQYRKFERELENEVGIKFAKREDLQHRRLKEYLQGQYQRVLNRCPLHRDLERRGLIKPNPFGELVSLNLSRDPIGRAQKLQRLNKRLEPDIVNLLFKYIRLDFLKKLLLLPLARRKAPLNLRHFLHSDFEHKVLWDVFQTKSRLKKNLLMQVYQSSDSLVRETDVASMTELSVSSSTLIQFEEYVPKNSKVFEAEMISIKGALFGRLTINTVCISFKSEEARGEGKKYMFGSTFYYQYYKKVNKKWKLDTIQEVVVKRYNLIRQAVEIYFNNSKSIFVSFFSHHHLQNFLKLMKGYLRRKNKGEHISVEIVEQPEAFFVHNKFPEKWEACEVSNFQYLMLLNKYGGRSFNDLTQYPVFPWILSNYDDPAVDLRNPSNYRPLNETIAGLSEGKKKAADEKLAILATELEIAPYQFGSHYLAARTVLGYMLRIEPFASLLIKFEHGVDASARMFHIINNSWNACSHDTMDNKELIPEFFYLPEMFANYNCYSFGMRPAEQDRYLPPRALYVRVDQAVMPNWARDNHHFVQVNALALESRTVSAKLENWIDLVFGETQQDPDHYNLFKELCDEEVIATKGHELNEHHMTEIQEFGSIPMKLFKSKHRGRDLKEYDKKNAYTVFVSEPKPTPVFHVLQVASFPSPIILIQAYKSRAFVLLNNLRLNRTKEEHLNTPHDRPLLFEKSQVLLYPQRRHFLEGMLHLASDTRRSVLLLEQGSLVVTCRHYDDSCKVMSTISGSVVSSLYFHQSMVMTICATWDERWLFSGALDGVVAKWDLGGLKSGRARVKWHFCDHQLPVVSIDACTAADLVASGSLDGTVSLRFLTTGKFIRVIKPRTLMGSSDYIINQVRISFRGYLVLTLRCKYSKQNRDDWIQVYSINGELIGAVQAKCLVNCVVLDESGYQFIIGGSQGALYKYDLLSLEGRNMFGDLDPRAPNLEKYLQSVLSENRAITAMGLTEFEGYQQLLIGLSNGEMFTYKYSTRIIGSKMFSPLQSLLGGLQKSLSHLCGGAQACHDSREPVTHNHLIDF